MRLNGLVIDYNVVADKAKHLTIVTASCLLTALGISLSL